MSLRGKLVLAQAPLAVVLVLVGVLSAGVTRRLGEQSRLILADNYRSVLAAERMKESLERMDSFALFILGKLWQRQRFLHRLRTARITPEELKERLDRGDDIVVVDLRHALDLDAEPHHIPGALHLTPDEIENRHAEIPRDRDVVLYCT